MITSTEKVNLASVTPSCSKHENVKYAGFWTQNFSACDKILVKSPMHDLEMKENSVSYDRL